MAHTQVSPGMTPLPSRLCPSHLRPRLPYRVWTLTIFAVSSDALASMRFLFVEPAFCLRLPSSSPSRSRTCRAASTSSCQVCNELSSSGRCALPGAQTKKLPNDVGQLCKKPAASLRWNYPNRFKGLSRDREISAPIYDRGAPSEQGRCCLRHGNLSSKRGLVERNMRRESQPLMDTDAH